MVQKTFEEYKQEMRDYYTLSERERCGKIVPGEKTTSDMSIQEITDGLYTNCRCLKFIITIGVNS